MIYFFPAEHITAPVSGKTVARMNIELYEPVTSNVHPDKTGIYRPDSHWRKDNSPMADATLLADTSIGANP